MNERSRANTLLIELLLVVFFFMLSAAILVQVFANAKLKSRTAKAINASMLDAQNIAEELYHTDDPDAVLNAYGFTAQGDGWELHKDGYLLKVTQHTETTDSGILRTYEISSAEGDNTLIMLPSTRFIPGEVSP